MRFPAATGWLAAASVAGFALVALAARARPTSLGTDSVAGARGTPSPTVVTAPPPVDLAGRPPPRSHFFHMPWSFLGLVLAGVLMLAVIALLVALVPRLPSWQRRPRPRRAPGPSVDPAPDDLARQVSDTLAAALSGLGGSHIRDAVILCWHRLQQAVDAAGLRRVPADTSSELVERLLATLPLSEEPLHRLAALYREARFSSHPISDSAVAQARADLARLRSELTLAVSARGPDHG
ncbi:DUF4129 domain-containing protein [Jatrophihabitans sp.]|uniref:DUF4129 domain-containing protein n=1 Tax=Jatrophihabitans sp. TaxID=1932789 RepID=UPI002BAFA8A4|nr:DUF4129 domain-containing protein [Jatrophihabitans sp.]